MCCMIFGPRTCRADVPLDDAQIFSEPMLGIQIFTKQRKTFFGFCALRKTPQQPLKQTFG